MKLKVCGMRDQTNIQELAELKPDYMGLIFYQKSKRYVGDTFRLPPWQEGQPKRVGVFVNHTLDFIFSQVIRYELALIQLHGDESAEFCAHVKSPVLRGARDVPHEVKTVKAFALHEDFDFDILKDYEPHCDYFLFDTKGTAYGGTGRTFNWEILKQYMLTKPLFMSGGLSLENTEELLKFIEANNLPVHVLDVNSRFEMEPGLKDIQKVKKLVEILQINC